MLQWEREKTLTGTKCENEVQFCFGSVKNTDITARKYPMGSPVGNYILTFM
jgi:hypothetical protein